MLATLRVGALLGLALALLEALLAGAGWLVRPDLALLAWLGPPMIAGATLLALRRTAAAGRDLPGQIVAGAEVGLVAGALALGGTILVHARLFPGALVALRDAGAAQLAAQGHDAATIADALALATPFGRGIVGFVQAMVIAVLTAVIAARWLRAPAAPGR